MSLSKSVSDLRRLQERLTAAHNDGHCRCGAKSIQVIDGETEPPVIERCPRCGGTQPAIISIEEIVIDANGNPVNS